MPLSSHTAEVLAYAPSVELPDIIGAVLISLISGFISISQRIVRGYKASVLWVASEFLAAALAGYLMYTAYPFLAPGIPEWMTMPILVACAAHMGGRAFQTLEFELLDRLGLGRIMQKNDDQKKK